MNNGDSIFQLNPKAEEIFTKVPNYFHFFSIPIEVLAIQGKTFNHSLKYAKRGGAYAKITL
jgi:hypothetical protein